MFSVYKMKAMWWFHPGVKAKWCSTQPRTMPVLDRFRCVGRLSGTKTTYRKNIRAESEVCPPVLFQRRPLQFRLSRVARQHSNTRRIRKIWQFEPRIPRIRIQQITRHQQTEQEARQLLRSCAILKSGRQRTNHAMSTSTTPQ